MQDEEINQKWLDLERENSYFAREWAADVLRIHPASDNWVCFCMKKKGWKNHWEQAKNIKNYLLKLVKSSDIWDYDIYVSQEEFFSKRTRSVENVAALNVNFLDLDFKLLWAQQDPGKEYNAFDWEKKVIRHCDDFEIPRPNHIIFSGGGVHLKWIYDEPIPRADLPKWQYAQKLLLSQFLYIGADPNSIDAARVLRLPGSLNHKNKEDPSAVHTVRTSDEQINFHEFVAELERSTPRYYEEFHDIKREWREYEKEHAQEYAKLIKRHEILTAHAEDLRDAENYWLMNALNHHHPRGTYLQLEIGGEKTFIDTQKLHETLREIFPAKVFMSLSETNAKTNSEDIFNLAFIPCNYVVLTRCPGRDFQEQKEKILRRCREYRGVGIPEANQIIKGKNFLLVEWTYTSALPGKAFTRWQDTQEYLCQYFEEWGAMDDPEFLKATAMLPVAGFFYDEQLARLEYNALENHYSFDDLARAVLNFSQAEVEKYRREKKAKLEAAKKLLAELKLKNFVGKNFQAMAMKRFRDIVTLLEMRQNSNGEVPQGCRELCAFWALNCARQAGLITSFEEFKNLAENLIEICGLQFKTECTVNTLLSANKKHYHAKTTTLINKLQITKEEQKKLKVIIIPQKKKKQSRADWLAEHSTERKKPWLAMGISRATWYRGRKKFFETCSAYIMKKRREGGLFFYTLIHMLFHIAQHNNTTGISTVSEEIVLVFLLCVMCRAKQEGAAPPP